MANVAQLVNCLHSLFLAHEDKFTVTPNYHVFEMFGMSVGKKAVDKLNRLEMLNFEH
jgi:alpha-L-arabinofuranosidase